jgi:Tfp pilus assembly protein PilF
MGPPTPARPEAERRKRLRSALYPFRKATATLMTISILIAVMWHGMSRDLGPLALATGLATLWVTTLLSVLAHELGHVVASRAAGLDAYVLMVGAGPSLFRRQVAGLAVDIGVFPAGGLTMIRSAENRSRPKWRLFVSLLGGPLVTLAALLSGRLLFPSQWHDFLAARDAWFHPGPALVLINGWLLVTLLMPVPPPEGSVASDIFQILGLPGMKQARVEAFFKVGAAADMTRNMVLEQYDAAFAAGLQASQADPSNWVVRFQLATLLLLDSRHQDAATEYTKLLAEPALMSQDMPKFARALVLNNYAWALYMLDDPAHLPAADHASAQAIELTPQYPSVIGTRGSILVALGHFAEGKTLLTRSYQKHRDPHSRASNLAAMAIAEAHEGDRAKAISTLEQARRLDPYCELLDRAGRVVMSVGLPLSRASA